jgi:CubicO group peptidase (beta-lactamase class C family)
VGFAMEEGLIRSVSDLVIDYVPALKGTGYDGVTLKDVLQMTSGVAFDENTGIFFSDINRLWRSLALGATMDDVVAARDRDRPPGTRNHITGIDTQVLAMVLREATGRTLTAYMEEKLWSRIGVEADADWLVDGSGMELAFCGLNALLRDYARFGLLYLNDGKNFRAQQIIPTHWIRASVTPDRPRRMPDAGHPASSHPHGYGYHWWLPEPADGHYCAIGEYGQFIYIHPRCRVVVVKISADTNRYQPGNDGTHESLAAFRAIAAHMSRNP